MNWFIIALASALLSAAAAVSQKKTLFDMPARNFVLWISLLNLAFSLPFFFRIDYHSIQALPLAILFFKSLLGAVSFICIMYALKNLEISGALPLLVLTPGLVAVSAYFILGDALSTYQIAGIVMLMSGTYLLEINPKHPLTHPFKVYRESKYYLYIAVALILQTASSVFDKLLLGQFKLPPPAMMGFQQLFYMLIVAAAFFFSRKDADNSSFTPSKKIWGWLLLIALLTLGYRYTQILAIKIAPVAAVLAVKRISVFIAAIAGGRLFNEKGLLRKGIAITIMVIGAIMIMEE